MPPTYYFDHVHVVSEDPKSVADYFRRAFDAKVIETVQDGKPRIDVDLNGLSISSFSGQRPRTTCRPVAPGVTRASTTSGSGWTISTRRAPN